MSGVAGADRVKSRADFEHFLQDYKRLISLFPGFVSLNPSGSYNSNPDKQDFGDIDLIVHIKSDLDKTQVKKQLVAFFTKEPETKIVPFSSEKHAGKRTYNAGEIVSVRYHDDELGYSAQVDNIIALDQSEASFKQSFLDMPAEKQGLVLGLVKIAAIETDPQILFKQLGINAPALTETNEEYEFNISSIELQLRKVTYKPGTYEQIGREVMWTSRTYEDLDKLLYQYNLNGSFDDLLAQSKKIIKNPRSNNRMQGVFNSMITVKSGEVGTAKGAGKIAAAQKVAQTFKEHRSLFRSLIEADVSRKIVFAFVRFQPPTIGHELLINTVKQTAEQNKCPYVIYVSRTQDHKKNPLSVDQKLHYLNKFFPGTNFISAGNTTRTPIEVARELNQKYTDLILVAGSDRAQLLDTLKTYNGKEYNYNTINFVSAGERDPDADDISGVSGTNVRQAAVDNDYSSFKQGLPKTANDVISQQLMKDIQVGMTKPARAKKAAEGGVDEGWKEKLAGAALAGSIALGSGGAHARVTPGDDPNINRLTGKPNATQTVQSNEKPASNGFSKEYLQSVVNGTHSRPMISIEKAKELLSKMQKDVDEEKQRLDPKCWKGYKKSGTKTKDGVRVNNCVPISEDLELVMAHYIKILESKHG
jgi:nicotinic acid mononucleotide adenylyltransferase